MTCGSTFLALLEMGDFGGLSSEQLLYSSNSSRLSLEMGGQMGDVGGTVVSSCCTVPVRTEKLPALSSGFD